MKDKNDKSFDDRKTRAAAARQANLERFKAKTAADDGGLAERLKERQLVKAARAARDAERAIARKEAEERDRIERAAAAELKAAQDKLMAEENARMAIERAAAQKAARDARYAARKARAR
jgi:hypothetical protein